MPTSHHKEEGRRGSALIMIVFTLFLVMLVVSAIFALSRQNFMNASKDEYSTKAEYAAKAGVEHAIAMLSGDPSIGAVSVTPTGATFTDVPLEGFPDITYTLQLLNNDLTVDPNDPEASLVTAPDGLKFPPGIVWVKSTGKLRDRSSSSSSSLVKLVGYQRPVLKQGIFGSNFVEISGNSTVEGWDFAQTPKALGRRGDVGVNATSLSMAMPNRRGLAIGAGSSVLGQVRAGVGSPSIAAVVQNNGTVTNLDNPGLPLIISQEATQVPRFVLVTDPSEAGFMFPHHLRAVNMAAGPTPGPTPTWVYRSVNPASPTPPGSYLVNDTANPGGAGTPTPDEARTGFDDLRFLSPGFYNLSALDGTARLENVVLRPGARYHFLGDVTLAGNINVAFHDPATSAPYADGPLPAVLYIDGDITFEPGCSVNMNRANETGFDPGGPLPPRRLQIYSSMDRGEAFETDTHQTVIGAPSARSKISCVLAGLNMRADMRNTDFWGGIQALEVSVRNSSHVYFDVNLWGVPLEGRGQMTVLMNTVQIYSPVMSVAAPAPTSATTAPAPSYTTYTYGPGWCSPVIPAPLQRELCY